jgi:hypothetical protein
VKRIKLLAGIAALPLAACVQLVDGGTAAPSVATSAADAPAKSMDALARDYVQLNLEIGTHEDGYIDAYYGPADIKAAAERAPRDRPALRAAIAELQARVQAQAMLTKGLDARRAAFLAAQLRAADTRLQMMDGKRFAFAEEAERLFGVRPALQPLSAYDAGLKKIAELVPGDGPLGARVDAYLDRYTIPKDRLQAVFEASIAACRAATAKYIALPKGENFRLEFVTGKSWSGYNYYQGNYASLIQINTDFPIRLSRAVDLGCHEGYPGHHAHNMLLEQHLARFRGWIEYSVYPLYSPQSLIAEGTSNYGIEMAFPGAAKAVFEREVLVPIAGIPMPDPNYWQVLDAIKAVSGARLTIAQLYLNGEIDRARAVELTQTYLLMSPARADQSVRFTENYRSYVINYGLGEAMVRGDISQESSDPKARWQRFGALISEPTLPSELRP